ncbi:MAG: signal peptidase I [Oscillospiraceae bacterium]|nr:signal peptidase I [Candidatus Limimonas coprohippi]
MNENLRKEKPTTSVGHVILTVIGIILCIIFIPILILNMILIVKGAMDDSKPPSVLGYTPLVVLSGSMDDAENHFIEIGDLIFVQDCDANNLKVNDVIAFMEGDYAVTHRIIAVNEDGTYTTQGDANNVQDATPVTPEHVIGKYQSKVSGLGNLVLFIQSTTGMLVCVGIPLAIFVVYDIIRRQMLLKKEKIKQAQLQQEIEELKQNPNQVDLPREVLKKPQIEAPVDDDPIIFYDEMDIETTQLEPAPERMAEPKINNAEVRSNEPAPQKAKVKVGVPKKAANANKPAVVKVKAPKKK